MFLLKNIPLYLGYWFFVVAIYFLRTGKWKFSGFSFSKTHYYLFAFVFLVPTLISTALGVSLAPVFHFALLGVIGVIGETAASIWWHTYFGQRFWIYRVQTVYHKYTSWLNFIPWAVGGMLYASVADQISHLYTKPYLFPLFFVTIGLCLLVQYSVFVFLYRKHTFHRVTFLNALFFFAPVIVLLLTLGYVFGSDMYVLAILFGTIATGAEYLYGKATEFFISKKMWTYTYLSVDRGHFTPLSIPLFILGGFYFIAIMQLLHSILWF